MRRRIIGPVFFLIAFGAAAPVAAQITNPDRAGEGSDEDLLPYRGTSVVYENALTALTFDPSAELYYNPTYVMSWVFRPRWYLWGSLSARLDFSVEAELTNSDWTRTKYEPVASDLSLGFVYSDFYAIPVADIKLGGGVWFGFPTSKFSQAQTLYFSLAPTFSMRRMFDVLGGLELSYGFKYTKYFNQYTTTTSDGEQFPCPLNIEDRTACYNMGTRNSSMTFSNTFGVNQYFIDRLYASLSVGVRNTLLYPVTAASVDTLGGEEDVPPSSGNTDHRASMSYGFEVGYDATDYLTVALGLSTINPQLNEEGGIRTPFLNRFTNIYLDVSVSVDGLVKTITASDEDEMADVASSTDVGAVASRW